MRVNRAVVAVAVAVAGLAWFAFPFLLGLSGAVGVVLTLLVAALTLAVYRLLTGPG